MLKNISIITGPHTCLAKELSANRTWLMGIAILMVTIYHLYCSGYRPLFMHVFRIGYIGVDIFILLSGFGLCYSYKKNSILTFYKKRIMRIFPLYFISALFNTFFYNFVEGNEEGIWDWFCNLTTLQYYQLGGHHVEWYLSALLLFYLLFPVFYYLAKKGAVATFLISWLLCGYITNFLDVYWAFNCFIARIPIFVLGILIYYSQDETKISMSDRRFLLFVILPSILGIIYYIYYHIMVEFSLPPFLGCCITPPLILLLLKMRKCKLYKKKENGRIVNYAGGMTLEIYCSQICCMGIVAYLNFDIYDFRIVIVYFALLAFFTYLLKYFNLLTSKILMPN